MKAEMTKHALRKPQDLYSTSGNLLANVLQRYRCCFWVDKISDTHKKIYEIFSRMIL